MNSGFFKKLILLCVITAAAAGLYGCGDKDKPGNVQTMVTASPSPELLEPTAAPSPTPTPTPEPVGYTGPDLRAQEITDDSIFANAAFLGNSLVRGLELYGGLGKGDFYAVTSASVVNVGLTKNYEKPDGTRLTLLDALAQGEYGKVYVLLGVNEISFDVDYFIELYGDMLDKIRESQPEADIYIMSLTPVTEKKSDEGDTFSMERISAYNQALYMLAMERECYFVDLVEALENGEGYLDAAASTDGIHLAPEKYKDWANYLRSHYLPED